MSVADQAELILGASLAHLAAVTAASIGYAALASRRGSQSTGLDAVPRWLIGALLVCIALVAFGAFVYAGTRPDPGPN